MEPIDKQSPLPLYIQLMDSILKMIEEGKYGEHDKLPSERELCEQFDVSRITVRQTFQELENDGYIYKRHGKGTYVAPKKHGQKLLTVWSFAEEMKRSDKHPETKVLSFECIQPNERVRLALHFQGTEEVFKVARLRLANGMPLLYEISYLPVRFFPGLTREQLEEKSMYQVFEGNYSVKVEKAIEQFYAGNIQEDEAKLLKIKPDTACMKIKRYGIYQGNYVEYTESVARGDQFFYTAELNNQLY
ncbi:GntR family transcriptional regulator [Neobacillus novalis]|uniref:GntR family transcriptional regulator n=1 Tax=Neobacillus novalis TaxID=220687 RepID=A0AA95SGC5_9BACI|nr:GntR family transcriptional regulator [Neobacillus novalis]WHY85946.1 GntR family transcriptional regulator [Neobacillus novalis]